MALTYSEHFRKKNLKSRKDVTHDAIEYAIQNSPWIKDKYWENAFNAVCRIPPMGRRLKVVYKKQRNHFYIITAFWME